MESSLSGQISDERVASLKKQYDLGQITRRELLNKLFVAGVTAPVAYALLGEEPAQAAGQATAPHLVKSTKKIQELSEQEFLETLKKEGVTTLRQLVKVGLAEAKAEKPEQDIWILWNDGKYICAGPT